MEKASYEKSTIENDSRLDVITDNSLLIRNALKKACLLENADVLLLSGGIDSSLLAALNIKLPAFTVGIKGQSLDMKNAQNVAHYLSLDWQGIEISVDEALSVLSDLVVSLNSYDLGLLNDIAIYVAIKKARKQGAGRIMSGDFADTIFRGFRYLWDINDFNNYLKTLLPNISLAPSRIAPLFNAKMVYPYLHPNVVDIGLQLKKEDNLMEVVTDVPGDFTDQNSAHNNVHTWSKISLRRAALGLLPTNIVFRTKTDLEFGAGTNTLEDVLESMVDNESHNYFIKNRKKFWNKAHYGLYLMYRKLGLEPVQPKRNSEYPCAWCSGAIDNGRKHCHTCGAYPANIRSNENR